MYFDYDDSASRAQCINVIFRANLKRRLELTKVAGANQLYDATQWVQQEKPSSFLSEVGGSDDARCPSVLNNTTLYLESNSEWIGWATLGAGPSKGPAYAENIEPSEGTLVELVSQFVFVLTTGQSWSLIQRGSNFWSRASTLIDGHLILRMNCKHGGHALASTILSRSFPVKRRLSLLSSPASTPCRHVSESQRPVLAYSGDEGMTMKGHPYSISPINVESELITPFFMV